MNIYQRLAMLKKYRLQPKTSAGFYSVDPTAKFNKETELIKSVSVFSCSDSKACAARYLSLKTL